MATRCKTVEFAIPTDESTLTAGTKRSLPTIVVTLPEDSIVFRSVTLEAGFTDHAAAASSATSIELEIELPGADPDAVAVVDTLTHTGESSVYHVSRDVTDYFADNFGPLARSATVGITVGANDTNNHWARLRVTYEYDDQSATQVKTIWYPIESTRALLTTTYQTVGGAFAIPAIKGGASILPEHNVTVRQVWVELTGNQGTGSATDFALDVKLSGDATELPTLYRVEAALATPGFLHAIWDVTNSNLDAPQPLEAKVTGVTDRVAQLCGWIGITYEFHPVGTTLVWNSLMLPAFDGEDQRGATTSARKTLHVRELWIEEPTTISLRPSAVFAFYSDNAAGSAVSVWVNDQAPRSFTTLATGAPMVVAQRMDADGTSGAGLALARGRNRIKVNQFSDSAEAGAFCAVNGFMILNYTSGKAAEGVGTHNQTRHFALGWHDADSTMHEYSASTSAKTPTVPEDRYFLNAVAMHAAWLSNAASHQAIRVQAQRRGDEGPAGDGAGWANVYHGAVSSSDENWLRWTHADCTDLFRRWASDPETARMDLELDRRWMLLDAAGVWVGIVGLLVTYHAITKTARGALSGMDGDGSGLAVKLSRSGTGEKVLDVTTVAGGTYEAAWYDDTEALVADVYEDDAHTGRSAPFFAEGTFEPAPEPEPLVPTATVSVAGIVQLATSSDVTAGLAVQASDTRLSDARTPTSHGSSHASDGSDPVPAATTSVRGTVELATDGESASGLAVQANDARLSNARTPSSHASSHASDGGDPIAAATTSVRGTVELATDGESASGLAVQANDSRLSNARTPSSHASSHAVGGSDDLASQVIGASQLLVAGGEDSDAHNDADDGVFGDGSGNRGITVFAGTAGVSCVDLSDGPDPTSGLASGSVRYDHSTDALSLRTAAVDRVAVDSAAFSPSTSDTLRLGTTTKGWQYLFFAEQSSAQGIGAGIGELFVLNEDPNVLVYRDDTARNRQISKMEPITLAPAQAMLQSSAPTTGTVQGMNYLEYAGSGAAQDADWHITMPPNYAGQDIVARVYWYFATDSAGNSVVWQGSFERHVAGHLVSGTSFDTYQTTTVDPPTTTSSVNITDITFSGTGEIDSIAGTESGRFRLRRDSSHASDTFGNAVRVLKVVLLEI